MNEKVNLMYVEPDCTKCMHLHTGEVQSDLSKPLACRRSPPTVHFHVHPSTGNPFPVSVFPPVGPGCWCGEFQPIYDTTASNDAKGH
jgi:hypothetical protein